ncbi:MAG TPA: metalloprotease TldD [Candidatus Lambdaproteobacteria bacterium]|jgi:TldD protein|nr:metalloprotease TldD [Candidatus Lambdaproteobacteria bacterium]|tara:strand:+ start:11877 stop:13373 length:1497 start_codon:yes stop_codon:yes gene_type:complete
MTALATTLANAFNQPSFSDTPHMASTVFERQMGVDEAMMQQVLAEALHNGGDYADLYFEYSLRHSVVMEEGIVKSSSVAVVSGVGIRVLQGEQTGYAYSEVLESGPMCRAARAAAAIATNGSVPLEQAWRFNTRKLTNHYPVLQTVSDLPLTEKIQLIQQAEATTKAQDSRIVRVTVSLVDSVTHTQIASSDRDLLSDTRPMFRMNVHCVAQDGSNLQNGTAGMGGRVGQEVLGQADHPVRLGKQAAAEALLLLDARQAPSGLMPVILGPAQSGILLHEAVGHPLEADFNRKGTSAYSGRLGEKVATECCTIYDSGTIAHDRGAINCDDEGIPAQENLLIENGILRGYMHDRISAQHYGVEASGNGRRESYAHYPMPRMTTTFLANGESDPEEILGTVKQGVYCESFSGGQVDISNGDFVFVPTVAWLVEDGRKTAPIKNFTLIGNGPEAMSKVTMVGNDFAMSEGIWTCGKDGQSVPVGVGLPTVLITEMTVGGMSE